MHHSDCLSQATFTFLVLVYLFPGNVDCNPANQFMCVDQARCVHINFCCEASHFPDCAEDSEEKNGNITGKTASAVVCENWHC